MPKGYWIACVNVKDPELYKDYVSTAAPAFKEYGARFIARGGSVIPLEGEPRARNVVIEFESAEVAKACYDSPQYQKAAAIRHRAADAEMFIVEGYDG